MSKSIALSAALAALLAATACAETSDPAADPDAMPKGGYDMVDPVANPVAGQPLPPQGGEWTQGQIDGRRGLVFRPAEGEPIFAMFCDERDGIVIERRGLLPSGPYEMIDIAFGNVRESLAVNQVDNDGPVLRATIPFQSELYTRLRDVEGTISIGAGQAELIAMPASPEIGALVRTCTTAGTEVPALEEGAP